MKQRHESDGATKSRSNTALMVFLVIAALLLLPEHRAHLSGWLSYWPYLLLLACPLMHLFMHGGHGHGGHGQHGAPSESDREKK